MSHPTANKVMELEDDLERRKHLTTMNTDTDEPKISRKWGFGWVTLSQNGQHHATIEVRSMQV